MKLFKSLTLLFTLIFAASCSTDDSSDDNAQNGQLVATVDGESFTASGTNATANSFAGNFSITGINSNGDFIILSVIDFNGAGTYSLSTSPAIAGAVYMPLGADNSFASLVDGGSGSLTITDLNEEDALVSGTFSFTGVREEIDITTGIITSESVVITAGSFTNLSVAGGLPDGDNNNVVTALIDGEDFTANNVQTFETTLGGQTTVSIVANNTATNQNIGISFYGAIQIGTFDLESFPGSNNYVALYSPDITNATAVFSAQSGSTVSITSYNEASGALEGSFQFVAGDPLGQNDTTYIITEGTFSVTVQ